MRSSAKRWLPALSILALLACATPARAQRPESADALIERALVLRDSGDDAAALALIVQAHALSPTPRSAAQLGLVEQALGSFVLAEQHLLQALGAASDPWIRRRRAPLEASLASVRQRLGSIDLVTSVPGARVSLGDEVLGTTPFAAPVRAAIGTVPVEVSLAGYRTQIVSIVVVAGELSRQTVTLQADAPTPAPVVPAAQLTVTPEAPTARVLESPTRAAPAEHAEGGSVLGEWWFWTLVGVVAAGASVGVAVALSSETVTTAPLIGGDEPTGGVIATLSSRGW